MYTGELITADFVFPPYSHQITELETYGMDEARALLWQMRTGKTKTIIDQTGMISANRNLDAVIIMAPNGVHENWITRELPKHHWPSIPYEGFAWRTSLASKNAGNQLPKGAKEEWQERHEAFWKHAEALLKADKLCWFAFPSEVVTRDDCRKLIARIMRRKKKVMLVVDESGDYGAPGSKKTHMVRALAKRCAYRRILDGTIVENSPLRAFSQYELLKPEALGFKKFGAFKERFAKYELKKTRGGRQFPELVGYQNLDQLKERMAKWSSVVLREDCVDLPDLVPIRRDIELTESQKQAYNDLLHSFKTELDGEEVSVGEMAPRLIKLQQICSGYLVDEWGEHHIIGNKNPRLEALLDEVERTGPGRNIIWCAFRPDMDRVSEALRARGRNIIEYHGRTSDDEKALAREAFAPGSTSEVQDLVGHPKSGGRGNDFSGADKIIWYSHTFDTVVRSQADERATAIGGQNIPVVDFVAPGVDEYILETQAKKMDVAEDLARKGLKEVIRELEL